jgi:hypothetical protein
MMFSGQATGCWSRAALSALILALAAASLPAHADSDSGWRDAIVSEYVEHLEKLDELVAACQKQRAATPKAIAYPACDPFAVGANDRVAWPTAASQEKREIRYDWLRSALLLASANGGAKSGEEKPNALEGLAQEKKATVNVDVRLAEARQRLADDAKQATGDTALVPGYADERATVNAILAGRAYQHKNENTAKDRFVEWLANILDRLFSGVARMGMSSKWFVWALWLLLPTAALTALIWFFIRAEWGSRMRITPEIVPSPDAPSAREWQLWLRDAQSMAGEGRWREAIHFLYWASISRLESLHLWPADRARTPREYLALVAAGDPRRTSLTGLTRSFERTWYGGRAARGEDYSAARAEAAALGVEGK